MLLATSRGLIGASNTNDLMKPCGVDVGWLSGVGSPKLTILGVIGGTSCTSCSPSSASHGCLAVLKSGAGRKANWVGLKLSGTDGVLWMVGGL